MAELTTIAGPTPKRRSGWRGSRTPSRVVADAGLVSQVARTRRCGGARQPEAHRRRQGGAAAEGCGERLDANGRNFVRVLIEPTASACCRRSRRCSTG